jgi:hypothetical protein
MIKDFKCFFKSLTTAKKKLKMKFGCFTIYFDSYNDTPKRTERVRRRKANTRET